MKNIPNATSIAVLKKSDIPVDNEPPFAIVEEPIPTSPPIPNHFKAPFKNAPIYLFISFYYFLMEGKPTYEVEKDAERLKSALPINRAFKP